jgi:hypothetical protein
VAGYNIYYAQSAAGPFSKINAQPISDTIFLDSGSGYYAVSAVDAGGIESVLSAAVRPAAASSGSGGGGGGGAGCFITTAQDTSLPISSWLLFTIAAVLCIRCSRRMRDFMS